MLSSLSNYIVTLFGLGYLTKAPGTIASLVGVFLGGLLLLADNGHLYLILLVVVIGVIGTLCLNSSLSNFTSKDPSEVVIDELIGQWVALWPLVLINFLGHGGFLYSLPEKQILSLDPLLQHLGWGIWDISLLGKYNILSLLSLFILFRIFDIWKPSIIGLIDKQNTPISIMLDDIFAGLFAGFVFLTLIFLINILS